MMALAALTQPITVDMVEAAALLCPIAYLGHIKSQLVLRAVSVHLDQVSVCQDTVHCCDLTYSETFQTFSCIFLGCQYHTSWVPWFKIFC